MSISCTTLYQDVLREIGCGDTEELQEAFVRAVNKSLSELEHRSDAASAFTRATALNSSLNLDENYDYVIAAGITFNLIRAGFRPSDPKLALLVYQDSKERWGEVIGNYVMNEDNANQANDTYGMTRLGSVVDS